MAEERRFPPLREGDWDWQMSAACRGLDTANFYHPENERGPSRVRREQRAKAVCSGCPVVRAVPALGARRARALRRVGRYVDGGARVAAPRPLRLTRPA